MSIHNDDATKLIIDGALGSDEIFSCRLETIRGFIYSVYDIAFVKGELHNQTVKKQP